MAKHILLIGVSEGDLATEYGEQSPAIANVTALKRTLLTEIEELRDDQVVTLINPTLAQMRHAIALITYRCRHGELCLIYYTGHGVIDLATGLFYLPAIDTQLDAVATTALSSDYIRQALPSIQPALQRLMVLDCLWGSLSATTGDSPPAQPLASLLADCNCALLTALGHRSNPWPLGKSGLSLYTQCLIEGLATGLADIDADGHISVTDLQIYMDQALGAVAADLLPVAQVDLTPHAPLFSIPCYSPEHEYRRSLKEYVQDGQISPIHRNILDFLRCQLGLTLEQSQTIEAEVMAPHAEHQENCDRYRQALTAALALETPLGNPLKKWLRYLQGELSLSYEDVSVIEAEVSAYPQFQPFSQELPPSKPQRPKLPAHIHHSSPHPFSTNGQPSELHKFV